VDVAKKDAVQVGFDRKLKLEFHGAKITPDAGWLLDRPAWLADRELDEALGLTAMAQEKLDDPRTGKNVLHSMTAPLRQSIFGRLGDTKTPTTRIDWESIRRCDAPAAKANPATPSWRCWVTDALVRSRADSWLP